MEEIINITCLSLPAQCFGPTHLLVVTAVTEIPQPAGGTGITWQSLLLK